VLYMRSGMPSSGLTALAVRLASLPRLDVLAAIANVARALEPLAPHERAGLMKDEAALLIDGLLVRVARGRGALDVAIGEGLDALSLGDRAMRLGYSGIGDYALDRLGIAPGTALKMTRLARALRERPLLQAAVRRGEVSARKAETVVRVARADEEAAWVERARTSTVRALAAAVKEAAGAEGDPGDEPWERVVAPLSPQDRAKLDEALAVAGTLLGATAPPWQRVEAICEEYLGAHPIELTADEASDETAGTFLARDLEAMKEACEHETARWAALSEPERFEAPPNPAGEGGGVDVHVVDERLRELAAMRDRWDALVGHLGMLLQNTGLWRFMFFVSLGHYAAERLGMSGRALEQRAALERRLWALPELREAMGSGRISYEKARLVAAHADETDLAALIARAEAIPCVSLRRELEDREQAQMCTRGELALRLPRRGALLLSAAIRAARDATGRWLSAGEALAVVAEHFVETWKAASARRSSPARRAIARARGWCQVPGCSRPAADAHHIQFRSRGGGDEDWNYLGACKPHHLHGIHLGWVRVHGRAPDGLRWELGVRPAAASAAPV
jgi:hypothetical protein